LLEKAQILPPGRLKPLQEETGEIIAIITTIIVNSKRKSRS
jgi:hypothetical protein